MGDKLSGGVKIQAQKLKAFVKEKIDANCEKGLFTLKFRLLAHLVEDLDGFGVFELVHSTKFGQSNVHTKRTYSSTSR